MFIKIFLLYIYLFYLMEIFKFSIISYSLWHFLKVHRMKKKKNLDWWFNLFPVIFIPIYENIKIFYIHFIFQIFLASGKSSQDQEKKKGRELIQYVETQAFILDACDRVIFLITAYRPTWPTVCGAHRLMSLCSRLGDVSNTLPRYLARPRVSNPT